MEGTVLFVRAAELEGRAPSSPLPIDVSGLPYVLNRHSVVLVTYIYERNSGSRHKLLW